MDLFRKSHEACASANNVKLPFIQKNLPVKGDTLLFQSKELSNTWYRATD